MSATRRFCRFVRAAPGFENNGIYTTEIPESGLCLSAFLVITEGDGRRVLMGHLNPVAPWDRLGALDAERSLVHSKGWMLPSSHLMLYESPRDAARRVLREQLGEELELSELPVVSEVGVPKRFPNLPGHWDLEFIFTGRMAAGSRPKSDCWTELRFVDAAQTRRQEVARSHDEVLENVGFKFRPD